MTGEIFYLDWNINKLFGWEKTKRGIIIASILEGILNEDDFPAVRVIKPINFSNKFYLDPNSRFFANMGDGGHKRALGHYIAKKPLKCEAVYQESVPKEVKLPISEIEIIHTTEDLKYFNWLRKEIGHYREVSHEVYRKFKRRFPHGKKVSRRI